MRKSLVQQAAAEYSKRSRTKRTRNARALMLSPLLGPQRRSSSCDRSRRLFRRCQKRRGGTRSAQAPRWKNAACRSPANRWGLGQSRRLASARCRVQATRPRTTCPHEAQRRKRAKSSRKMAGANAQARPASGAQVRTPACAGILAPLPHGQKV